MRDKNFCKNTECQIYSEGKCIDILEDSCMRTAKDLYLWLKENSYSVSKSIDSYANGFSISTNGDHF